MKRVAFLVLNISLLCSCDLTLQHGPYNLTILTKLKSCDESVLYFDNYNKRCVLRFDNQEFWNVNLIYNSQKKNIVVNYYYNDDSTYNPNLFEKVSNFLNDYYFISNEKLEILFPPENTVAINRTVLKSYYTIKKFESKNDRIQDENYLYFEYTFDKGYLFLKYFRALGKSNANYQFQFDT